MKCPKCQAKLLPVDGEMFCLQCGTAVMPKRGADVSEPAVEDTTDPLLQKAIMDSLGHEVKFKPPVAANEPEKVVKSFVTMRQVLAPAQLVVAAQAAGGSPARAMTRPVAAMSTNQGSGHVQAKALDFGGAIEALAAQLARGIVAGRKLPKAWVAGLVVFGIFLAINGTIYAGYNNRVYPGVKVGAVDLGGVPFSQLHSRLESIAKPASLTVRVGEAAYPLAIAATADPDRLDSVEMQVRDAGHSTPLPLAGLLESLVSKPLTLQPGLTSAAAKQQAEKVAEQVAYAPTPAAIMVVAGKVLLIADKPGQSLDLAKAANAIQGAYGKDKEVGLQAQKLQPVITAGDYAAEVERAETILSQAVKIHVKAAVYQPTVAQVGDWLVFPGPGKGVAVNGAGVATYVAGLPGRFDRVSAVTAMIGALNNGQSLDYTASVSKVTAVPKLANTAAAWPLASYGYCLDTSIGVADASKIASVFSDKTGWALGGRLSLARRENSCNFRINIVPEALMAALDVGCKGQTTCLVGNQIDISVSAWQAAPGKWTGTIDAYRTELINHEVGHWLGFQHTPCLASAASSGTPILSAPDVVLGGCSPNWYAIPADQQRTKILPGFD